MLAHSLGRSRAAFLAGQKKSASPTLADDHSTRPAAKSRGLGLQGGCAAGIDCQ